MTEAKQTKQRRKVKGLLWVILILFVTGIGMWVSTIIYANRVAGSARDDANRAIRESEKTHCIVYDLVHEGQQQAPPTTPQGKRFAEAVNDIRTKLRCDEK